MSESDKKRNLVLLLNVAGAQANWQISAHLNHISSSLDKVLSKDFNLIIMPVIEQTTSLYWLDEETDAKTFEEIKDKIRPALHVALEECLEIKPAKLDVPKGMVEKMQNEINKGMKNLDAKTEKN